ncbi:MAG: hypothetical protein MUC77_07980 [Chromatiaceae bacterium]|jgi:hypothetical protein|nr:hypothetical protein [Chromatiaceae bacterium]
MPLLIDELELTLVDEAADAPGGAGDGTARTAPGATLTPLEGDEVALAAILDLIRERRARLRVD